MRDDLGADVPLSAPARRVVSLVPSLTEAFATSVPKRLVGATDWCTHPANLDVARVRGTKNPDLAAIRALSPDLVVVNKEENRELDVRRLREAGVTVWVTRIETVEESLDSMGRLFAEALSLKEPDWLAESRRLWSEPVAPRARVAVPIWRDPWMVVGSRRRTPARRALRLHRRRRPGGVHHPHAARLGATADVVRPGHGRGPCRAHSAHLTQL